MLRENPDVISVFLEYYQGCHNAVVHHLFLDPGLPSDERLAYVVSQFAKSEAHRDSIFEELMKTLEAR